jgi:hypothetical protein
MPQLMTARRVETTPSTDAELRKAFGEATVALMHLAVKHWHKGDEDAKQRTLDVALYMFAKEHQEENIAPEDWAALDTLGADDDEE